MRINKFVEIKHSSLVCLEFCSFASRIRILISLTVCLTFRPFTLRPTLCCSSVVWKAIWNSINAPESIFNALKVCLWYFLRQVPGTDVNRRGVGRGLRPRRRRRPFCSSAAAAPPASTPKKTSARRRCKLRRGVVANSSVRYLFLLKVVQNYGHFSFILELFNWKNFTHVDNLAMQLWIFPPCQSALPMP